MTVLAFTLQDILIPVLVLAAVGFLFAVIILTVSRLFAVAENPMQEKVREILPGVNCGACGYSGCDGYAAALASGAETDPAKCPVGGASLAKDLAEFLGLEAREATPMVAHVMCQGSTEHTQKRFSYQGTQSCSAAHGLFSGPNSCTYGCLGFGDCVHHCPYGAIDLIDGIAVINDEKCRACGQCVQVCPKDLIFMVPYRRNATIVSCRNKWPGAQTRRNCKIGCIGCRKCYNACEYDAIIMDGPLAVINQEKCVQCGACVKACPTGAIQTYFCNLPCTPEQMAAQTDAG